MNWGVLGWGALGGMTAVVVVYALWLRTWMAKQESGWAKRFLDWIEPFEIRWWRKSETILVSQWMKFVGLLVPVLSFLEQMIHWAAGFDLTPFLPVINPAYVPYLMVAFYVVGLISQKLRERTTKPLEVVAIPSTAPLEVRVLATEAAAANTVAVDAAVRASTNILNNQSLTP